MIRIDAVRRPEREPDAVHADRMAVRERTQHGVARRVGFEIILRMHLDEIDGYGRCVVKVLQMRRAKPDPDPSIARAAFHHDLAGPVDPPGIFLQVPAGR